jgi:hypothetical protein
VDRARPVEVVADIPPVKVIGESTSGEKQLDEIKSPSGRS